MDRSRTFFRTAAPRGAFDSDQTPAAFRRNYLTGGHDQVVFLRLDPDSVHLEHSPNEASPASRKPTRSERPSRTDYTRPEDPKILGETRHGQLIESPEELATKNALLDRAVEQAKHGVKPSFRFVGDEHESVAEVARQNVKLDHAVKVASRTKHKERATETWNPGMSFENFKSMLSHIAEASQSPSSLMNKGVLRIALSNASVARSADRNV